MLAYFIFTSRHHTLPVLPVSTLLSSQWASHWLFSSHTALPNVLHNLLSWLLLNAITFTQKICSRSWGPTTPFHWIISIKKLSSKLRKKKIKGILQKDWGFSCVFVSTELDREFKTIMELLNLWNMLKMKGKESTSGRSNQ